MSELKVIADSNFIVVHLIKTFLGRIENIVGKGENDNYQHFLLFSLMFSKAFL